MEDERKESQRQEEGKEGERETPSTIPAEPSADSSSSEQQSHESQPLPSQPRIDGAESQSNVASQPAASPVTATASSSSSSSAPAVALGVATGEDAGGEEDEGEDDDEESEYEDEDEDDDDEEEEDEEPKLKYQRLGASVTTILKKDSAKVLLASEKFLLLGTSSGRLYVLDLNGNEILQFHPHSQSINDLSLDASGDHVASCSNDGTVVITNLFTKDVSKHAYTRSIKAVALPGQYGQNSMFAVGGSEGKFMIHTKGWFSAKDHVIHGGEGPIHAIKWRGELLAWANDAGVKIYDVNTSERITHISRTDPSATRPPPPAEQFRCNLCWSKPDTLLIGWADSVKIGVVKSRGGGMVASAQRQFGPTTQSQNRYVQIVAMFTTEYMICGIAPWGPNHLVLMAFLEEEEQQKRKATTSTSSSSSSTTAEDGSLAAARAVVAAAAAASGAGGPTLIKPHRPGNSQRPELRIVTLTNEEVSADALPIMGYADYSASDYRLDFSNNGLPIPLVSPHPPGGVGVVGGPLASPSQPSPSSSLGTAVHLPPSSPSIGVPSSTGSTPASLASAAASLEYLFYILAPHDIVVAKPRDYDDHLTWLLQRSRYEEALHYAQEYSSELKIHNSYMIGESFLKYLFEIEKDFNKAATYCTKLLGNSKSLWETYVYMFVKYGQISKIAEYIPTSNPQLSNTIYELVLQHYLDAPDEDVGVDGVVDGEDGVNVVNVNHSKFLHLIQTWNHHLYHIKHIIEALRMKLSSMELVERERSSTEQGRLRERQREKEERKRRLQMQQQQQQQLTTAASSSEDPSSSSLSTESKKLFLSQTSLLVGTKVGQLDQRWYPTPPSLPPISTLTLLESLGELYLLNKQYSLAFDLYVRLQKSSEIFKLLQTHHGILLETKLCEERLIPILMRLDLTRMLELLLQQVDRITPQMVMEQLRHAEKNVPTNMTTSYNPTNPPSQSSSEVSHTDLRQPSPTYRVFQYEYLHALFRRDHSLGSRFHDDQVLLYAEFAPKELMYFLKNSNGYLLERALESCERYKLFTEMVFLLKRMGNTPMALKILIDELHDVKEAIAFVEENSGRIDGVHSLQQSSRAEDGVGGGDGIGDEGVVEDHSLWEELITRSLNNPNFLSDLLEHVGSHYVDLSKLIRRIPNELEIPKLKLKLITILNDCALQQSVIKGCTTILKNDCKSLIQRLNRRRKRAMKIPIGTRCALCDVVIVSDGNMLPSPMNTLIAFFCRHIIHRSCYEGQQRSGERRSNVEQQCPRCNVHHHHHHHHHHQTTTQPQPSNTSLIGGVNGVRVSSLTATPASRPSPSLPTHTRAILPQPSSSTSGTPRGGIIVAPTSSVSGVTPSTASSTSSTISRTIPLPISSNVLPPTRGSSHSVVGSFGNVVGTPTNGGGLFTSSSGGRGVSPASSPPMSTPTFTPTPINQIKPQPTFSRTTAGRTSVAK